MKTWFVYCGDTYYPMAALGDLVASFTTKEEAEAYVKEKNLDEAFDWIQVVDIRTWL